MKLYDAMTPNSLRVNVFLAEKGIDIPRHKVRILEGETRTPRFRAKNSLGELPTVELDDGRFLAESVAICRLIEDWHPEPNLMGVGPEGRAFVEMWNRRVEQQIFGPMADYAQHTLSFFADKYEQIPAYADSQMRRFFANLAWLDRELDDGRPYIAGNALTIADITGMAALFVVDLFDITLPDKHGHVKRWEEAVRSRPSFSDQFDRAA